MWPGRDLDRFCEIYAALYRFSWEHMYVCIWKEQYSPGRGKSISSTSGGSFSAQVGYFKINSTRLRLLLEIQRWYCGTEGMYVTKKKIQVKTLAENVPTHKEYNGNRKRKKLFCALCTSEKQCVRWKQKQRSLRHFGVLGQGASGRVTHQNKNVTHQHF